MNLDQTQLGPLANFFQDDSITEIMVNNHRKIFVEKKGQLLATQASFESETALLTLIHAIAASCGRMIDAAKPYFDGYLPDGSRVNASIPPMAPSGANLTIRRFRKKSFSLEELLKLGSMSDKAAYFLHASVRARLNIIVSGGTGTGKTSFLNVLSGLIPETERIISIEDVSELRLQHPNWVRLESVHQHAQSSISTKDCLVNALRMRPDRIIVGECRREETFDMLQAMNTGHEGSMTTIHANTPRDCLSRIESLVATSGVDFPIVPLRKQIVSAVDLIVQLRRLRTGQRVVQEIVELSGMEQNTITMQTIFTREKTKVAPQANASALEGELQSLGLVPSFMDRFSDFGIQFPPNFFDPNTKVTYRPE